MSTFTYQAMNTEGKQVKGTMDGLNRNAVVESLTSQGLHPTQIVLSTDGKKGGGLFAKKVKLADLVLFTRQLSTMVSAGVPLLRALTTLQMQSDNEKLKEVIGELVRDVQSGAQLADALEKHPDVFSTVYVNMVRSGEAAGIVDDVLKRLAIQVEKSSAIKKKIKSAMTYPIVLLVIMILAFFGLMIFVLPTIGSVVKGLGGELPPLTAALLGISDFTVNYWYILIPAMIGAVFGIRTYLRTPAGKSQWHAAQLKLPVMKVIVTKTAVANFTRTYASLIGAGVSVVEALKVTGKSLGNEVFEKEVEQAATAVVNGKQLSQALEGSAYFPAIVSQMMAIGEETGQTDTVIIKVAEFYEEELDATIASLSSLLEPIMIVVMGGAVGIIAVGVLQPITGMSQQVS